MPMSEAVMEVLETAPGIVEHNTPTERVAELLRKAAYRVGQPGAWTQHYLGRLADGSGTYVRTVLGTGEIQSRCMLGALYCEYDRDPAPNIHAAYEAIVKTIGTGLVADWNDHPARTQTEVVSALLHAAEIAEG
jgi:class 3 adenylate cyclase